MHPLAALIRISYQLTYFQRQWERQILEFNRTTVSALPGLLPLSSICPCAVYSSIQDKVYIIDAVGFVKFTNGKVELTAVDDWLGFIYAAG